MNEDKPKLLADTAARNARRLQLGEPHIASLADFVQRLRYEHPGRDVPDFDPWDGGVGAEILYLLEAPGPRAVQSGFVSRDNPDETAKNFFELNTEAGIARTRTVMWNMVPWYIGDGKKIRAAESADISAATPLLARLLELLPRLRAIVLIGAKAQRAASTIATLRPELRQFKCPHPSPLFVNRGPGNRTVILNTLREVSRFAVARCL